MCASTGWGDSKFPLSVTSGGHRQEIGALTASRSPMHLLDSVYICMFHHVHENVLLLLITCDACVCVIYIVGTKTPVQSHWESIYGHNDKSVSWMCKSNVVHRLTSIKNDAIHSLYSRCNIKHSCKGKDLDTCKSVSLQSPLQGCRMCTVTLQYNLSLSGEEPMKKEFSWAVLFFFLHRELCLRPDKNVCVCLMHWLSSRCTCLPQSYGMQRISAQSKVEGEHPKDTRLAAVLISWLTAQVIYKGWRFLQLPSQDRVLEKKAEPDNKEWREYDWHPVCLYQSFRGQCGRLWAVYTQGNSAWIRYRIGCTDMDVMQREVVRRGWT